MHRRLKKSLKVFFFFGKAKSCKKALQEIDSRVIRRLADCALQGGTQGAFYNLRGRTLRFQFVITTEYARF